MNQELIPAELIYDSAERLRRANRLMEELRAGMPAAPVLATRQESDTQAAAPLTDILQRAYSEIIHVLGALSRSRAILEQAAVDRLHRTSAKLREVNSTTELATVSILDNLERGLTLLDALDADPAAEPGRDADRRNQLRELLHATLTQLQFQDITSQQLSHATGLLNDLEQRLRAIAEVIDTSVLGLQPAPAAGDLLGDVQGQHYDVEATAADASSRQALADQIFA